jgi:hypothetical protein
MSKKPEQQECIAKVAGFVSCTVSCQACGDTSEGPLEKVCKSTCDALKSECASYLASCNTYSVLFDVYCAADNSQCINTIVNYKLEPVSTAEPTTTSTNNNPSTYTTANTVITAPQTTTNIKMPTTNNAASTTSTNGNTHTSSTSSDTSSDTKPSSIGSSITTNSDNSLMSPQMVQPVIFYQHLIHSTLF